MTPEQQAQALYDRLRDSGVTDFYDIRGIPVLGPLPERSVMMDWIEASSEVKEHIVRIARAQDQNV